MRCFGFPPAGTDFYGEESDETFGPQGRAHTLKQASRREERLSPYQQREICGSTKGEEGHKQVFVQQTH